MDPVKPGASKGLQLDFHVIAIPASTSGSASMTIPSLLKTQACFGPDITNGFTLISSANSQEVPLCYLTNMGETLTSPKNLKPQQYCFPLIKTSRATCAFCFIFHYETARFH